MISRSIARVGWRRDDRVLGLGPKGLSTTVRPRWFAMAMLVLVLPMTIYPAPACAYISGHGEDDPFPPEAQKVFDAAQGGDHRDLLSLVSAHPELLSSAAVSGETLLQRALALGMKRTFRRLLMAGADPAQVGVDNWSVIQDAARTRDIYWLKTLLAGGVNPNGATAPSGDLPPIGKSVPIGIALMSNNDRHFAMLLKAGADPNLADGMGNTVLHLAAQTNKPWHVLALLQAGANPYARNAQGQSFQRYLWMTKERLLTEHSRKGRKAVIAFLQGKAVPLEMPDAAL